MFKLTLKGKRNKPIMLVFMLFTIFWLCLTVSTGQSEPNWVKFNTAAPKETIVVDSLDKQTGLIVAPGLALVKANCLRCHSPQLISGKRATRDGWVATIRWMQKNQGLWDLGKAEPEILNYLAVNYAPANEGRRPLLKNIQWYKL